MADTDDISASEMFDRVTSKEPVTPPETVTEQEPERSEAGQPRDEHGRFTKAEQEAADKAAAEAAGEPEPERQAEPRIPPARLREEAEARRRAEAERDEAKRLYQEELAAIRREMQGLRQPPQKQAEPPKPPDLIEDPDGWRDHVRSEALKEAQRLILEERAARVDESFEDLREGNPKGFEAAYAAVLAAPQAIKEQIARALDPGKALMRWHGKQRAMTEVGHDLDGYRTRVAEEARKAALADPEFRKQVIEAMRAEAGAANPRPETNITDLPSLNRATGSAASADPGGHDDRQVFARISGRRK